MAISCDPNDLLAASNCIQSCLTEGQMQAIQTNLLCTIANNGTGGGGTFTPGSVIFAGASGQLSQDNANLFFNDTSNQLLVGGSFVTSPVAIDADVTLFGVAAATIVSNPITNPPLTMVAYGNNAVANTFLALRTRSATGTDANTILQTGETVFAFSGRGADGATFQEAGRLMLRIDGTPGIGDMPGKWEWYTSLDGTASVVLRMTIKNDGTTAIGPGVPSSLFHVMSNTTASGIVTISQHSADTDDPDIKLQKSRGTQAAPTVITVGDLLGTLHFQGYSGAGGYVDSASIRAVSTGTIASTRVASSLIFATGTDAAPTVLTDRLTISNAGLFTFGEGNNLAFGTATGTKIGTATNQLLAFWNKAPIVQPTNAIAAAAFVTGTSGIVNDSATFGGYTIGQIAAALIATGILT